MELVSGHTLKKPASNILGQHLLLELYDCDRDFLNLETDIQNALVTAAREAGATVVETAFHRFSPHGISGVVVIAESHITVHTWPEYGYAALDVFTCGDREILGDIQERLVLAFSAKNVQSKLINRGLPPIPGV